MGSTALLSPRHLVALLAARAAMAGATYPAIPQDRSTPVQQRLGVSGANAVSIGWNTYQNLDRACVRYGTDARALAQQACAPAPASTTYNTSRTWAHTVQLAGLAPATRYYYQIESGNSTVESFLSPRAAGDRTPFTASVVVDLGVYGADGYTLGGDMARKASIAGVDPALNHTTIARLADTLDEYEWVLHPGDLGYADDWYLTPANAKDGVNAYEAILERFYDQLAPIAGRKPYMVGPGNHEAGCAELGGTAAIAALCPAGQTNFSDFDARFGGAMLPTAFASTSPSAGARVAANTAALLARPPFWYSFEYGMVHVAMLDTETDFADAPDAPYTGAAGLDGGPFGAYAAQQLDFLAADLAAVDRAVTPWLVVAGHRPWYSTGGGGATVCAACQRAFEPLLVRYGVDLGVFGHVHNSQRFAPVANGSVDPRGLDDPAWPMYIVAGGAGSIEGTTAVGANVSANRFAYAAGFSYATLTFEDEHHLKIQFVDSQTGVVLDSSTLFKSHAERFPGA